MFMKLAHRGLYTCIPYLLSFPEKKYYRNQFVTAKFRHARLSLHTTGMPRAQADMWLYLGIDTKIPEKIIWDAREQMVTMEENMNRPMYESPDVYEKVNYDAYTEGGTNAESRDWWD